MNWILSNMQNDAELMKNELENINKAPGTSVVKASTSDKDFNDMIQKQLKQIKKSKKNG